MIRLRSLRFRLLAGAAVWIALALTVAGLVLSDLFEEHARERFDTELSHHLDQLIAGITVGPDGIVTLAQPLSDPRFQRPLSGLYWQVDEPNGTVLRSRSLWDGALDLPSDGVADGAMHRHRVPGPNEPMLVALERVVLVPGRAQPYRLVVAADERELTQVTGAFTRTLILSLTVLALTLIAAALVQVEVGLRPLALLRGELGEIRRGRKRRLGGAAPAEVEPLIADLNTLLAHNEEVVARARLQAGNLAHALKTNLAVLGNEAAALDPAALEPARAREAGTLIARQVDLMRRHIDYHMARARAAASRDVPGVSSPVGPAVETLRRTLARLHADRHLDIAVGVPSDLVFKGEQQDLEEMLGNLLDNACKWARHTIRVSAERQPGGALLVRVEDDGPGLPPDRREAVLAPGVRLDESVPGSGLGLAVVRDLAELYGGTLRLGEAQLGGLRAELILPAAPA